MQDRNNFCYKAMDWYDLLGFSRNEMNSSKLTREEYCSKYLEVAYQNCLSMLNRNDLIEINLFYKIPSLNYCAGKIENLAELREKIQEAYNTLKDPQKRKEYEFEIFGIFCREYPEDEVADQKFKDRAIQQEELDQKFQLESNSYWKKCLSLDYWKNWQEKITTANYKEEIKFYIEKRSALRMFILKSTSWKEEKISTNFLDLVKKTEEKYQNMSKEEWNEVQNQPPRDGELREMSTEEISKMLGGFATYGWNFNEGQHNKPMNKKELNEDYKNIVLNSKRELEQWMKKNEVEEIFLQNSSLTFKGAKQANIFDTTQEKDMFGIKLLLNNLGKHSISRRELENELKIANPERDKNNFSLNPWIIGGGILVLAGVWFFKVRKSYK